MKSVVLGTVLALLSLGLGQAAIIPTFVQMTNLGSGVFGYDYDVVVSSDQRVQPSTDAGPSNNPPAGFDNHFTFFDFAGFNGNAGFLSGLSALFSISTPMTGPSAYHQAPTDSSSLSNIDFTYTGSGTLAGGTTVGRVRIQSTIGSPTGAVEFVGQGTTNAPGNLLDGTVSGNELTVTGPAPGGSPIPEPITLVLFGSGLIDLGLIHRRRSHRSN